MSGSGGTLGRYGLERSWHRRRFGATIAAAHAYAGEPAREMHTSTDDRALGAVNARPMNEPPGGRDR